MRMRKRKMYHYMWNSLNAEHRPDIDTDCDITWVELILHALVVSMRT